MSLLDKLMKNSTIKGRDILSESTVYNEKDFITTSVPAINIALSGDPNGGLSPGLLQIAGPSKHFKSAFTLLIASAYMKKYPDAILMFYDSEFGTPDSYFTSFDIPKDRVLHTPITNIEEFKHDIMSQLQGINRGDHVCIVVDSIGNLASKKEVDDAIEGKSAADMTRAKALKSLGRMVTPHLTLKDIPMICVNHTYRTLEMFSKDVVSGGCLVAGTKIQMYDNTLKNIENIKVGELVKTLNGPKLVSATWDPTTLLDGYPECYEIEFDDGMTVTCSSSHKFLIEEKWVEAQKCNIGDVVKTI